MLLLPNISYFSSYFGKITKWPLISIGSRKFASKKSTTYARTHAYLDPTCCQSSQELLFSSSHDNQFKSHIHLCKVHLWAYTFHQICTMLRFYFTLGIHLRILRKYHLTQWCRITEFPYYSCFMHIWSNPIKK